MQQRSHQGLGVQFPFGALGRDGDRVGNVGLAVVAQLAQMGLVGKAVGLAHLLDIGGAEVVQIGSERGEAGRGSVGNRFLRQSNSL